jgi:hypothetical protein
LTLVHCLAATSATAAGINLSWGGCSSDPGATASKIFACQACGGNALMTVSFDPPEGINRLSTIGFTIDVQSLNAPLPPWWDLENPGSCRPTSLAANTVFAGANCAEPWMLPGSAVIDAYLKPLAGDSYRARILGRVSVDTTSAGPVVAGTEYYAVNLALNRARTIGTGACPGCSDPVCLQLKEIQLIQPPGELGAIVTLTLFNTIITWQTGADGMAACLGAIPTMNTTWGRVKSFYR